MNNRSVLFRLTAGYSVIVLISLLAMGLLYTAYFPAALPLSPVDNAGEAADQATVLLGAAIILALLFSALMSFVYARQFTRPLETMQHAAMELARGNYEVRVGLPAGDEIGRLGDTLDLLAVRLGYTIDQLFQEQGKLQDILASISEGILAFDPQMRLISSNTAAWTMLGGSSSEGWDSELRARLLNNGVLQAFEEVMRSRERRTLKTEWNHRTLEWILAPIFSKGGSVAGSVALVRDLSESERLERMRKEFIANVSHELRTPLTVIRGSAEALQDGTICEADDIRKYYSRILGEVRGLERLVSDLLDLARLQSGKLELMLEQLDVQMLIEDVIQALAPVAKSKGILLKTELAPSLPPVGGDYDRLRQVLIIFIDNAIRHSPGGSSIQLQAEASRNLVIRIKDNGPGISADDLPYIWERFYKADKSRSQSGGGTGLGLSIARYLIDLHRGTARLESTPGHGTTVTIELPLDTAKLNKEELQ